MKKEIKENKIGNVKIFKDDLRCTEDFEAYKTMFNSHIEREGTADEYVSFNTVNLKDLKDIKPTPKQKEIKEIYQISQYNSQGGHCCYFGLFTDKDKALEVMLREVNKLYPGFKKNHWYDSNSDVWHYDEEDFFIKIEPLTVNVFGEI